MNDDMLSCLCVGNRLLDCLSQVVSGGDTKIRNGQIQHLEGCRSHIDVGTLRHMAPRLPCRLCEPLDGASPLWNKGVLTCTTYARGEPPCKHCTTMPACPVRPARWINSRIFYVSVAKRARLWSISMLWNRSCIGSLSPPSGKP